VSTLARELAARGAYRDLVAWCEPYGDDAPAAWAACPRGDWLLAIAASREDVERSQLVLAACACARLALDASDSREARDAIEAAEAWARGARDPEPLAVAAAALEAALERAVDPCEQAVLAAALCALASRDDAREAPGAAGNAVQANVLATGECAFEPVVRYVSARSAELVRELVMPRLDRTRASGP
jgi:hypothetical protein